MEILARLKLRTGETNDAILLDCIESAKNIYLSRRYPFEDPPTRKITADTIAGIAVAGVSVVGSVVEREETFVEDRYLDWQYRCALAIYTKDGADGQKSHSENGISRSWGSESIPKELLHEIPPFAGVPRRMIR